MSRLPRGPMSVLAVMVAFQVAMLAGRPLHVAAIENKCSACFAIAAEMVELLAAEKPRNHLDMRHRLNSKGVREGKQIDYRVSELRALELLDQVCGRLKKYSLAVREGGGREWSTVNVLADKSERTKMVAKEQGRELATWCDREIERHEEMLESSLRTGALGRHIDVEDFLCREATDLCAEEELPQKTNKVDGNQVEEGKEPSSVEEASKPSVKKEEL